MSKISSSPKTSPQPSLLDLGDYDRVDDNGDSRRSWFWIAGGTFAALLLRLFFFTEPLWLDELHTAWTVDCRLDEVASRAAIGNQAPLYFWLIWCVTNAFQLSEFTLRIVSLAAGTLLVAVSGRLVFHWSKSVAATATVAILLAISPTCIFYSTEARPYGLLQLCGVLQLGIFWSACKKIFSRSHASTTPWFSILAIAVSSAVLFYLHYTAVLFLAAEFLFVLAVFVVRLTKREGIAKPYQCFLKAALMTVLLCIPAAVNLISVVMERKDNWESVSSLNSMLHEIGGQIIPGLIVPAICLAVFVLFKRVRREEAFCNHTILLIAIVASIPIELACAGSYWNVAPLALTRYVVCSVVLIAMFAAMIVGTLKGKKRQWFFAMLFVLLSTGFNPFFHSLLASNALPPFRHEQWSEPIAEINQHPDHLPVFVMANVLEDVSARTQTDRKFQDYLKFPVRGIYKINNPNRIIPLPSNTADPFSESDVEALQSRGGWLLFRATQESVEQALSSLQVQIRDCGYETFASPDSDVILVRLIME